jgi:hypothetical protein
MSMMAVSICGPIVLDYQRALSVNDRAKKREVTVDRSSFALTTATIE